LKTLVVILACGLAAAQATVRAQPVARTAGAAQEALSIYARQTGRMILRPALLPPVPESILAQIPADTNAVVDFIEKELARNDVDLVADGDYFVRVLPAGWENTPMAGLLARIPPPHPRDQQQGRAAELSPPGLGSMLSFEDLLLLYSELRERTVLRPAAPLALSLQVENQIPLTREETAYALTVILTLNGLVVVDDGEHLVQIVPAPLASKVRARAPKPEAGADRIAPDKVPVFYRAPRSNRGQSFVANVDGLVAYYAELAGRKFVPSEKVGQRPVAFRVRTPLTREELRYAIETTLAFDGLTIEPGETNSIHAARLAESR
jgi:hypothetical protein